MRHSNRGGLHSVLALGLAISAVACGTNEPPQALTINERSSASTLSGTWLYYPLDSVNTPGYAGYCGYGCGGNYHDAYDLKGNVGDVVRAASGGTLTVHDLGCGEAPGCIDTRLYPNSAYVTCGGQCGNWAIIQHDNGMVTKYCHLDRITRGNGRVEVGNPIGTLGHTGSANTCQSGFVPHLHFALSTNMGFNGIYTNGGCTLSDYNANCVDPGVPPGETTNDCGCATIAKNLWVQVGGTVVTASCMPNASDATVCAQNSRLGTTACGPNYLNNCGSVVDCGSCGPGSVCSGGICTAGPPTCPSGTCGYRAGWCGAGAYCGSSGIINGMPDTLYQCNSSSGLASVINSCGGYQCIFRPGLDDVCAFGPPTCPVNGNGWYGSGLYCGRAQGMGYAEPYVVYYCSCPGCRASANQTCSSNCVVAPNGYNDHC
jgi:Peptidase family M23